MRRSRGLPADDDVLDLASGVELAVLRKIGRPGGSAARGGPGDGGRAQPGVTAGGGAGGPDALASSLLRSSSYWSLVISPLTRRWSSASRGDMLVGGWLRAGWRC